MVYICVYALIISKVPLITNYCQSIDLSILKSIMFFFCHILVNQQIYLCSDNVNVVTFTCVIWVDILYQRPQKLLSTILHRYIFDINANAKVPCLYKKTICFCKLKISFFVCVLFAIFNAKFSSVQWYKENLN